MDPITVSILGIVGGIASIIAIAAAGWKPIRRHVLRRPESQPEWARRIEEKLDKLQQPVTKVLEEFPDRMVPEAPSSPSGKPGFDKDHPPTMSLTAPGHVSVGDVFTLRIVSSTLNRSDVSGYATEILLPEGLRWIARPICHSEAPVGVENRHPSICSRIEQDGAIRHVIASAIQAPPLPPLSAPSGVILEIDLECTSSGDLPIALTAVPHSALGAVFFDTHTNILQVETKQDQHDRLLADIITVTAS